MREKTGRSRAIPASTVWPSSAPQGERPAVPAG